MEHAYYFNPSKMDKNGSAYFYPHFTSTFETDIKYTIMAGYSSSKEFL